MGQGCRQSQSLILGGEHRSRAPAQHIIPCRARRFRVAVRAERCRAAGERNQQGGFRCIKTAGGSAKPGQGAGAYAFDIAGLRRKRQPDPQDFLLAEARFQLKGAEDFNRLGTQPAWARFQQPRRLHGDSGPARDHPPRAQPLPRRTRERPRINASMVIKAPILCRDQQIEQNGGDILRPRRQAPKATRCGQDGKNASFTILHLHAHSMQAREVGREQSIQREGGDQQRAKTNGNGRKPPLAQHGARRLQGQVPC